MAASLLWLWRPVSANRWTGPPFDGMGSETDKGQPMRLPIIAALCLWATSALSSDYSEHRGVVIFTEAPCVDVIEALDADVAPEMDEAEILLHGYAPYFGQMAGLMSKQGMAWGFILGYDAAKGGLHADGATTLQRLRTACAESPGTPAKELLDALDSEFD